MAAGERRQYSGGAAQTTLNGAITGVATSLVLTDATGWPDGSVGPFFIVVDPGLAAEEKIKCVSRTGATVTVVTSPSSGRGADSTAATSHTSGAVVQHVLSADDADKWNAHINDLNDNHPSLLNSTRHDTTARHSVGTVIPVGNPTSSAPGDVPTQGVANALSRSDHAHGREGWGVVGDIVSSTATAAAAAGNSGHVADAGHRHAISTSSAGASAPGDSASTGTSAAFSRADHQHSREGFATPSSVGQSNTAGSSASIPHADHVHAAPQHLSLLGRSTAGVVGTPPAAATGPWVVQAGTVPVALDGSGNGTLTFPTSFPTGVLTVQLTNGDASAAGGAPRTSPSSTTTAHCGISMSDTNVTARINYFVVGW